MEQNIRILEPAGNIRRMAREALRGRWKAAILAYILYSLLLTVPTALIEIIFGGGAPDAQPLFLIGESGVSINYSFSDIASSTPLIAQAARAQAISGIYMYVIQGPLLLGLSAFLLAFIRGAQHGSGMILDGFNSFFRAFGLFILMTLFIFLWSMLFIIPGIIASFAYAQVFFLLADDPRAGRALRRSRGLMIGNKWKYFCLMFSFFGWLLLTGMLILLVVDVPVSLLDSVMPYPALLILQSVLISVLRAPVWMYMSIAGAIFYDILMGRRRLPPLGGEL